MAYYDNVIIENAKIKNRNFAGKEKVWNGQVVNAEGKRNFCVILEDLDMAAKMREDGWNIKYPDPSKTSDEDPGLPYLPVEVSFKNYAPTIIQMTASGKTRLTESNIKNLDQAEILNVDLIIRPYNYDAMGRAGIKAYCKEMWVTIEESIFAQKHGGYAADEQSEFDEQMDDIPF